MIAHLKAEPGVALGLSGVLASTYYCEFANVPHNAILDPDLLNR